MDLNTPTPTALPLGLSQDESLLPYNTWKVGGLAKYFYQPESLSALKDFLHHRHQNIKPQDLFWLGLGSNVLIRDGGFPGIVIHTLKGLGQIDAIESTASKNIVRFEAGVTCAKVAKYCVKQGLAGGAFFAGIPGTMGGALAMNAGAFGSETWPWVVGVETIDINGQVRHRLPTDFEIGYREVIPAFPNEWFVAAYLSFDKDDAASAQSKVKALLKERNTKQPIGQFSCGSVFKNPHGHFAAQLIEASKLKGRRQGDAEVSTKHANFIINRGAATANDIETLVQDVMDAVWHYHQIKLEPEFKIVGVGK